MIDELKNIKARHRKRYGSRVPRVGTDDDVAWLIAEVERLRELEQRTRIFPVRKMERPDLKLLLMKLGIRMVNEHGWEPWGRQWLRFVFKDMVEEDRKVQQHLDEISSGTNIFLIAGLCQQLNGSADMRATLDELGFDWPMIEEGE